MKKFPSSLLSTANCAGTSLSFLTLWLMWFLIIRILLTRGELDTIASWTWTEVSKKEKCFLFTMCLGKVRIYWHSVKILARVEIINNDLQQLMVLFNSKQQIIFTPDTVQQYISSSNFADWIWRSILEFPDKIDTICPNYHHKYSESSLPTGF